MIFESDTRFFFAQQLMLNWGTVVLLPVDLFFVVEVAPSYLYGFPGALP